MKRILVITVVIIILIVGGFLLYKFWPRHQSQAQTNQTNYSEIELNGKKIKAEIVDNEESRMKGLSSRESLCADCGMLFIFEKPDIYPFWMKEMNFNLDIIWLKDKKVVEIWPEAKAPKNNNNQIDNHIPQAEADMVLEVNPGFNFSNGLELSIY